MRVVITGGLGFVGSHLVDSLHSRGHKVVILDHNEKRTSKFAKVFKSSIQKKREVTQILQNIEPDIIIHLAGKHSVIESSKKPNSYIQSNVNGTINILEYMKSAKRKPKLMIASSAGALYGDGKVPYIENSIPDPTSIYGVTKAFEERLIHHYNASYGVRFQILRISNIFGPGQEHYKYPSVVTSMIKNLLLQKKVPIYDTGSQTRDFIYIGDVVSAIAALLPTKNNTIYNVSSQVETSINKLYEILCEKLGLDKNKFAQFVKKSEKVKRSWVSSEKLFNETKWKPKITLDKGLDFTINHFKKLYKP